LLLPPRPKLADLCLLRLRLLEDVRVTLPAVPDGLADGSDLARLVRFSCLLGHGDGSGLTRLARLSCLLGLADGSGLTRLANSPCLLAGLHPSGDLLLSFFGGL